MDTTLLRLSVVFAVLTGFTAFTAAAAPSHPLSQIDPIDEDLDMSGGPGGPYNITGIPGIEPYNSQLSIAGQVTVDGSLTASSGLDMAGNDISNFFGNNCGANEAISQINPDGTYQCANVSAITSDQYVDEAGDTMNGPLTTSGDITLQSGATVTGLPTPSASSDAISRGYAANTYLNRDGSDKMTGSLDMDGNSILNVGTLQMSRSTISNIGAYNIESTGGRWRWITADSANVMELGVVNKNTGTTTWDVIDIHRTGTVGINTDARSGDAALGVGGNIELSGNLQDADGTVNVGNANLDINTNGVDAGIKFNGAEALTGTTGNGWLRLNQNNDFSNGIYTPGYLRVDGGMELRGNLDMRNNQIQNAVLSGSVQLPVGADQYQ